MEHAEIEERAPKRVSGRGRHLWKARRVRATHQWQQRHRGSLGQAVDTLFPWHLATYPGRIKGVLAVLQGRVLASTLKHWLRGTRGAPAWAIALVSLAIDRRIAELQHAKAILEKEKAPD